MKRILFGSGSPAVTDFALLLLRLFTGLTLAFAHGIGKIPPQPRFIDTVTGLGLPAPHFMAWMAGISEFVGGILLALGLLTRPAALMIVITMAVAAFMRHGGDPFRDRELPIFFGVVALVFLIAGPGRYALDATFAGSGRKR
jgi:putative oxidoreductase